MIPEIKRLSQDIYRFYRYDCCWPYAVSFYLVLVIYWCETAWTTSPSKWGSIISYSILLFYYLHNLKLRKENRLNNLRSPSFFISFLTFKVVVWGIVLVLIALK